MLEHPTFEKLCDHYHDTCSIQAETVEKRNRLFFLLLVGVGLFTINLTDSSTAAEILSKIVETSYGVSVSKNLGTLNSLLWLIVAGMSVRYFQVSVQIERQYSYIHRIEVELNNYFKDSAAFTREGKSYISNYPMFSNWLHIVYTWVFPLMLGSVALANLVSAWCGTQFSLNSMVDYICFAIIEISLILYLIFRFEISKN